MFLRLGLLAQVLIRVIEDSENQQRICKKRSMLRRVCIKIELTRNSKRASNSARLVMAKIMTPSLTIQVSTDKTIDIRNGFTD